MKTMSHIFPEIASRKMHSGIAVGYETTILVIIYNH